MTLTREAVSASLHGGAAGEGALEFVLTSAANDRMLSVTLSLLLANVSAALDRLVVELEARVPGEFDISAAEELIDEVLAEMAVGPKR